MNHYETVFIATPVLSDVQTKELFSKFQGVITENGGILYEETRLGLECQVLYADLIKASHFLDPALAERWYGAEHGGFHKMYIAEITHAWVRE